MVIPSVLAGSAGVALASFGYLLGVRRGRAIRHALADERDAALAAQVGQSPGLITPESEGARATLVERRRQDPGVAQIQQELSSVVEAIRDRDQRQDAFRDEMRGMLAYSDALAPLVERERLSQDLASIRVEGGLGALPSLLATIADKAGLAWLVLSDDAGLPLAVSEAAQETDEVAADAAFLLKLGERAAHAGQPRPLSFVVLDDSNRMIVHRTSAVADVRFTLSGSARGRSLAPGILDPALVSVERALGRPSASSS